MASTVTSYRLIANDIARFLARTAARPRVAGETAYYLANIGRVESPDDFVDDHRLFRYALEAYELAELARDRAFVRTLLREGGSKPDGSAGRLSDSRRRDFVAAFDFATLGSAATRTVAAQAATVERYVRRCLEEEAGAQSEGVRLALRFERKAPDIRNAYQILADPDLVVVVRTALRLSPLWTRADLGRQADALASRIDFDDFQDPGKLGAFVAGFAAAWDLDNPPLGTIGPSLGIAPPSRTGLNADVLSTLQSLKTGSG